MCNPLGPYLGSNNPVSHNVEKGDDLMKIWLIIYVSFEYQLQEKDAQDIEIPNIRWDVFELMMRSEFLDLPCY